MSNQQYDELKLKKILINMNKSDIPIENFYEQVEKEYGNKVFFSQFKSKFEAFYQSIPKSIIIYINI